MFNRTRFAVLAVLISLAQLPFAVTASAAAFTPGNIVVYRIGTGAGALSAAAQAVFLDEYTPAGALVQSIALPTSASLPQRALTSNGTSSTEGYLTRSNDGRYLIVPGYDAVPGTTVPAATVNRVVGRIDASGSIDTSTTEAGTTANIRGATSTNGSTIWLTTSAAGVRATTFGASTAATQLSTTVTNLRATAVFGGQLYVSAQSGAFRLATPGSGTPTTSGQTTVNLPGFPTATGSPYQFLFADLSGAVAGYDTVYVADDGAGVGIQKYSLVAGSWTLNGTITAASVRGLTGYVSNGSVTLFGATGGTGAAGGGTIYKVTDNSGYNAAPPATVSNIATAATNTDFRGIAIVPSTTPSVSSIARLATSPTNATSVQYTVTFSENVTGVDTADFALTTTGVTGASVSGVTGSGSAYTVTVNTGSGDGTIRLDLADNDTILNAGLVSLGGEGSGNGNFTTGEVYSVDKTAPSVVSINRANASPTNAATVGYTVTFSESVTGVDATDFTVTSSIGASVAGVTGSGTTYIVTVNTGSGDGNLRLDFLDDDTVVDGVGNPTGGVGSGNGNFLTGQLYAIDKTAPAVLSITRVNPSPTAAASVDFTVTFTEAVTGVDTADFALTTTGITGANVTNVTGSGATYTVTASTGTGATGTLRLDVINGASISDTVGNPIGSGFTGGEVYTIDRNAPSVSSVVRGDANPTNAGSVHYTVTFSQSVTGVDTTDFTLTTTGVTGATVTGVTGSGTTYTVTVGTGTGDGTLRLDVLNNGSIQSGTSVPLTGGTFTTGEVYTIDKTAPTVQSIVRVGSTPTNAASVQFTVTFSESVTGVDTSDFAATTSGLTGASVTNVSGSGTTYTVTAGTGTGDGTLRLDFVSDSSVVDAATNAAASFNTGQSYTIDKTAPAVQSSVKASTDPSSAATVDFTVTFTESVTGVDGADFTINAPGITGTSIANVTGSGTTYTVTVNSGSGNAALRLDLTGNGTVIDGAGNSAATFTGGESYTMQGTPPAPTGLNAAPGNAHVALAWNAAAGATSYNVKRGTVSGGPYTTLNSAVATTSYDDLTAVNGTPYFYVVSANGTRGPGTNSNEAPATPVQPAANTSGLVFSQVYGGGGNAGSVFKNDFMEVFNRGSASVNVTGWSVQYQSAAGTGTWQTTPLNGTILPGHYYLVQEVAGAGGTTSLPAPDATGAISMAAGAAKVALVNTTTALSGGCPTGTMIADLAGYGTTASCFEGAGAAPTPSATVSIFRANGGCTDTDNNAADFATGTTAPRNSASPTSNCSGFAVTGTANPSTLLAGDTTLLTATVTPGVGPTSTGITVTADLTSIGGSATQTLFDDGTNGDVTIGDNIFSFSTTVAPATPSGVKSLPVTTTDAQLRSAGTTISLTVAPGSVSTIAQAKVDTTPADTVPDLLGQLVRIQGVVTSIDFRGGTGIEYYIQDATGGIDVFSSTSDFGSPFPMGANLEVVGTISQFQGLTEIIPSSITTISGLPAVTPQSVTLSQLADGVGEPLEGKLVVINNVTITSGTFPLANASGNVTISDGTASGTMRIDSDTDIDGTATPGTPFTLTGIVSQSDTTNPFDAGYQVLPRGLFDINIQTPPAGNGHANPTSAAPGATALFTVAVTPGQNPTSTGVTVTADLSAIGGSATQTFFDNGTNGDVTPGDGTFSFSTTVAPATTLGPKTLPFTVADGQLRSTNGSISFNVQSAGAPPPPTGLGATAGNLQVALAWTASSGATSYNVYRATVSGGPYTVTVATNVATTSYTDLTVSNGTRYYYVVTASIGPDESGPSNEANALPAAPPPTGSLAKVYFVDIGQGASTLIVSPTGKTLLVDGGPTGQGTAKVIPTLNTLGITTLDYTILTHYHIDHDGGLAEVIGAGRLAGTAYDNGDDPTLQPPNFSTSPTSTYGTYAGYVAAINAHAGTVTRAIATPGTVIDLGGGMRATIMAQGGHLLSGGQVAIDNSDLNTESISVFIEYNNFDFLVSGDMTGGGSTDTANTPDVETFVGQMVGDIDVLEFDHHGSTTANNRRFLKLLKAEVAEAEAGFTNTFGHPNRETFNKFLNTPDTTGNTYAGTGIPAPGNGPVAYQTDPSPTTDDRCTLQGYSGASTSNAGNGTLLLKTDGTTSYTIESFDDGGVRIPANAHVYALDATGAGVTTNFPPTVQPTISPVVPLASDTVTVNAAVFDREDPITSVTLNYNLNGIAQAPVTMSLSGGVYTAAIGGQPDGTRVDYTVTATAGGQSTSYQTGYFSGTTPISTLRVMDSLGSPLYWGYAARVQGVITSGTGNFATGTNDDYLQDSTGGAINVWRTIQPTVPAVQSTVAGVIYSVAGVIDDNAGRLRLDVTPPFVQPTTPYQITFVSNSSVPAPLVKSIAQVTANPESLEAQLITINNCHVTAGTIPASPASLDSFLTVSDGSGSFQLKIDHNTDIPGMATPSGTFAITGILQQDDFLRPFDSGYDIAPRNRVDLGGTPTTGPGIISIAAARIDVDGSGFSPGDYVPDLLNQTVHIQGVVTSINFRQSNGSGIEYYVQDPTAGVDIFSTATTRSFSIGDNLDIIATVKQFNGLTELDPGATASNLTVLAPGTLPGVSPQTVTVAQLGDNGAGEPLEGQLVRLNNVTLVAPPATWAASTNYNFTDGTNTGQLRISPSSNLVGAAAPAGTFSLIGVVGQFDSAAPFDSGYQLFPRTTADILPPTATPASIAATAGTPQSAVINSAFVTQLAATVKDGSSATIAGVNVTFTAPASGASGTFPGSLTSATVATDANGIATAPPFTANSATGPYNVQATINALSATFGLTNISPAATHFSVTAPASVTAGVSFNVTVTALDTNNAVVTGYTGTVHFTSSSSGVLPGDYTFVAGDSGTHTFSVTLTSTGNQTVGADDTANGLTGSAPVSITPPPATHFSVTAAVNVTAGVAFNVTVTALDASEATVTGYTGTAHFASSSAGTLPSDYTFAAGDSGTHTFSVTLTTTGAQSVTATDTGTPSITGSANTTVGAAPPPPATHLSVSSPSNVTAGVAFNVTVTALDASNATVAGYAGTVHFTTSAGSSTLPADYTFVGGDSGSHTFSVTLNSTGTQSVTTKDIGNASIAGTASTTVNCPPLSVTASNNGPACTGGSIQLTATTSNSGVSFGWTGPGGYSSSQQNPTVTVAGAYVVTITGTGGCTASSPPTNVVFTNAPAVSISAPASVCANHQAAASVADAGPGATYNWTITGGTIVSGAGTSAITFSAPPTSSSVTLHLSLNTPGGCSGTASKSVSVKAPPGATVPATIAVCGAQSITIPITLTGTAPWTIIWSDGFEQDNVTTSTTTRSFNATTSTTLGIEVLLDASCSRSAPANLIHINVDVPPAIATQPHDTFVAPASAATFTVSATGTNLHFQWFLQEGNGVSKAVGTDTASYTIDPVHGNSTVWVVVSNGCGTVESLHVSGGVETSRRRAAGH